MEVPANTRILSIESYLQRNQNTGVSVSAGSPTKKPKNKNRGNKNKKKKKKKKPTPHPSKSSKPTKKPKRKWKRKKKSTSNTGTASIPTLVPTFKPSFRPTPIPSADPTALPSSKPTPVPTPKPSFKPTPTPSSIPTFKPSPKPTKKPSPSPTPLPSENPSAKPSRRPTSKPTLKPSPKPTSNPSSTPNDNTRSKISAKTQNMDKLFYEFKLKNHIAYSSETEHEKAKVAFISNFEEMQRLNAITKGTTIVKTTKLKSEVTNNAEVPIITPTASYGYGSPFSAIDAGVFQKSYHGFLRSAKGTLMKGRESLPAMSTSAPIFVKKDWTSFSNTITNRILTTGVYNQGSCGSAWIFSAIQQVESDLIRVHGTNLAKLSVQQVMDCIEADKDTNLFDPCQGGNPYQVYEYIHKAMGIATAFKYGMPYSKSRQICQVPSGVLGTVQAVYSITDHSNDFVQVERDMLSHVVNRGPLSVCLATEGWQFYQGGIVMKETCGNEVNHCAQIVGVDTTRVIPYWIVRNSWGTDWGEQGFIYIEFGVNACQITSEVTYVEPSVEPLEGEPTPQPSYTPGPSLKPTTAFPTFQPTKRPSSYGQPTRRPQAVFISMMPVTPVSSPTRDPSYDGADTSNNYYGFTEPPSEPWDDKDAELYDDWWQYADYYYGYDDYYYGYDDYYYGYDDAFSYDDQYSYDYTYSYDYDDNYEYTYDDHYGYDDENEDDYYGYDDEDDEDEYYGYDDEDDEDDYYGYDDEDDEDEYYGYDDEDDDYYGYDDGDDEDDYYGYDDGDDEDDHNGYYDGYGYVYDNYYYYWKQS
eukprot:CAMPEP_0182437008 /NCGR_PEP_ID=MMETSP1167-20130531/84747_1 /TAXON_ID=2988 /ORGANISM="Mallomonas Sp, Strain CCMP3275" /LENGTH=806 /DNA_ID=CAMNT_0024629759 /DNA_START=166 /DNA_END=2587 /DNA_ORIENTATION=+